MTPEQLARAFHESYERHAVEHGYETRRASAVPWEIVPAKNRALMVQVAGEMLMRLRWHRHRWEITAKVTPPLWDPSAIGYLERCVRCGKLRAR
jgi:hypothetical protein